MEDYSKQTVATRSKSASTLPYLSIRRLSEDDIETIIVEAGGKRAHLDADKRTLKGADFVLGSSVIELKILEDEGLDRPERQQKLAKLFRKKFPRRPTIVLDRRLLGTKEQLEYDHIVETPVKTAVKKAGQQLRQSRSEYNVTSTVLWVVNNGYLSLNHDALLELVERRATNDSSNIDAVVVSGAYLYSDSFDNHVLWLIDCIPIHQDRHFQNFETLKGAWNRFAGNYMTTMLREPFSVIGGTKGPVVDLSFQLEGVTYVMPAPQMECKSEFFINGRPRNNSTGLTSCPPVATVFAGLSQSEWMEFKRFQALPDLSVNYDNWIAQVERARSESTLKPFIVIPITYTGWKNWIQQLSEGAKVSPHRYATDLFQEKISSIIDNARERTDKSILPHRYLLLITEEIGQDLAFDVSHLFEIRILLNGSDHIDEIWTDKPMFFEQALAVAAAEAIARGVEFVFWEKDKTYAWN